MRIPISYSHTNIILMVNIISSDENALCFSYSTVASECDRVLRVSDTQKYLFSSNIVHC